jgi:hypothetical protein
MVPIGSFLRWLSSTAGYVPGNEARLSSSDFAHHKRVLSRGCYPFLSGRRSTGDIGFSGPALASSFPIRLRGLPTAAVPRNFYAAGSSSRALCLLFRVSRAAPACRTTGVRQPSVGSHCPIATTACGVHCMKARFRALACRGLPKPAPFRPRRFSRPRRLPPPPALRVYFAPQPRTGFALQGLPLPNRRASSSLAVALLSFTNIPCRWV